MEKIVKEKKELISEKDILFFVPGLSDIQRIILSKRISTIDGCKVILSQDIRNMENPLNMKDMRKGAERAVKAILNKEKILCIVDYDQDGIASGSILYKAFIDLFGMDETNFEVYVTNRHDDGYGFSMGTAKKNIGKNPQLIITADLGSSDGATIDWYLKETENKCDIVVTDHHHISEKTPPTNALAFINPQRKDSEYKDRTICGAVVAFNYIVAIRMIFKEMMHPLGRANVMDIMDYTAAATIADCMDLRSEMNRFYINYGLEKINEGSKSAWRIIKSKVSNNGEVRTDTIAFQLAPRINAVSRMGGDGQNALNFLVTKNDKEAEDLFKEITEINEERKLEQASGLMLADEIAQEYTNKGYFSLIIEVPGIEHGVAGIVASKIVEKYGKPTVILGENKQGLISGSGRSIEGFDLRGAVVESQEINKTIIKFGGHEAAIGMSLDRKDLEQFRNDFDLIVRKKYNNDPSQLRPIIQYDAIMKSANDFTLQLVEDIKRLEPYGQNFSRPLFGIRATMASCEWTNKGEGDHLKVKMLDIHGNSLPVAMWFNATMSINKEESEESLFIGKEKTYIFEIMENNFRGQKSVQISIVWVC
jgi:single-stranded-DNA-specific exonuclease